MYACVCKAIKCIEIKELIESGANSIEKIGDRCGAGTDCGSCINRLKKTLAENELQREPQDITPVVLPIKREAG